MENAEALSIIRPAIFDHSEVIAFFSTSLFNGNLDDISKFVNIPKNNIYLPVQKHTNRIHVLQKDFKPVVTDAVLTDKKGILIGVQVADCVPVLLNDREKGVIGAVHAGWRGTVSQILKNALREMKNRFGSSAGDILVAIGPSIRRCCYNVGSDVKNAVLKASGEGPYYHKKDGRYFIDLADANLLQALSIGIRQKNIWQSDECTFCNPARFYSYRYSNGTTGRQGGFIMMW